MSKPRVGGRSLFPCHDQKLTLLWPASRSLDYSFNSIRHISHLNHLANMHTLYFVQNKISRVRADDLTGPIGVNLRSLELGGNKLRVRVDPLGPSKLLSFVLLIGGRLPPTLYFGSLSSISIISLN